MKHCFACKTKLLQPLKVPLLLILNTLELLHLRTYCLSLVILLSQDSEEKDDSAEEEETIMKQTTVSTAGNKQHGTLKGQKMTC